MESKLPGDAVFDPMTIVRAQEGERGRPAAGVRAAKIPEPRKSPENEPDEEQEPDVDIPEPRKSPEDVALGGVTRMDVIRSADVAAARNSTSEGSQVGRSSASAGVQL
ncbi:hypothetical protein AB0E69_00015 [Kribbella sp. NPDC026611]|uniref:hypothetical protein n=1 Tax=Kribbella sp. NPDC026611 TaxID=3154911 RepID=UPI0033DCBA86